MPLRAIGWIIVMYYHECKVVSFAWLKGDIDYIPVYLLTYENQLQLLDSQKVPGDRLKRGEKLFRAYGRKLFF